MSQFSLSGKFGVKFGVETSPGLSSFRAVTQQFHNTQPCEAASQMREEVRKSNTRCEECKSAVTAQPIVKTEQNAGLAAFIHTSCAT